MKKLILITTLLSGCSYNGMNDLYIQFWDQPEVERYESPRVKYFRNDNIGEWNSSP